MSRIGGDALHAGEERAARAFQEPIEPPVVHEKETGEAGSVICRDRPIANVFKVFSENALANFADINDLDEIVVIIFVVLNVLDRPSP
jgi:hypothetical protein